MESRVQVRLATLLDHGIANYREPQRQKRLADAIADYIAAKEP